jgi:Na+/proline symporter
VCFLIGLAIFTYYSFNPVPAGTITGDTALTYFISTKFHTPLPGLIIAGFMGAALTVLSGGFNSLATVATKDFYQQYFSSHANDQRQVFFSKLATVTIGFLVTGFGMVIACVNSTVGQTMMEITSLWFAYFSPIWVIFLLGVTTSRVNTKHIFITLGFAWVVITLTIVWFLVSKNTDRPLSFMVLSLPGPIAMIISGYVCAFFSKPVDSSKTDGLTLWTLHKNAVPTANTENLIPVSK